jgi:LCCL domain-containing protein
MSKRVCVVACAVVIGLFLVVEAVAAPSGMPVGGTTWSASATAFRGKNGTLVVYHCPAAGTLGPVWGTNVYTDDSYVCSAAVQSGLITVTTGGTVTIKILPGRESYVGSVHHGVLSNAYGVWTGSYSFYIAPKGPIMDGGRTWTATAAAFQGKTNTRYRYSCPPAGKLGPGIGTNTYAANSSVCSAAVQAGQISVTQGGNVIILMQAGRSSYAGTFKNGVTSLAAGPSKGSFTFTTP